MNESIERDWKIALERNTLISFRKFLKKYHESEYVEEAMQQINNLLDDIIWLNVSDENNIWAYEHYIYNFKNGKYIEKAKTAILELEEINEWEKVKNTKEIKPLATFIHRFPESKYAESASKRITMLEEHEDERKMFLKIMSTKSHDLYKKYISKYPNGLFVDELQQEFAFIYKLQKRIEEKKLNPDDFRTVLNTNEEIDWRIAKAKSTLEAYGEYYKKYPNGKFTDKAKAKIDEIENSEIQKVLIDIEIKLWDEIQEYPSAEKCEEYLTKFPNDYRSQAVKKILSELGNRTENQINNKNKTNTENQEKASFFKKIFDFFK